MSSLRKMQKQQIFKEIRKEVYQRVKNGEHFENVCHDIENRGIAKSAIAFALRPVMWRIERIVKKRGYW